ncbi:diphosphoinositol polyphosphate phosphohydrolase 2 [Brachionus plicatilis]|uniref:diphosphoinositol-polyphosphate diphosphatase n=1 Tax=Brachionus plicatilis TaxID=10195 RepID=A0A3M7PFX7_BRAPC|nr:diphosphoinositol polyphosphate phosphohydrolase 2 [Brachionus plicatilis]
MVTEKPKTDRVLDNDGFKKRASCVCVRNENENEVLLISSSRNKNRWVVPGGGIEDNENPEDAAEREVFEEAGVIGRLDRFLGVFENQERKHRTTVYLLIVDKELDEWEENTKYGRLRKWFSLNEAISELEQHKPVQVSYLNLLKGVSEQSYLNFSSLSSISLPIQKNPSESSCSLSNSSSNSSSFNSSPVSASSIKNFVKN